MRWHRRSKIRRTDPEKVLGNEDRSAVIQACLAQLSAPHREVIDLVYYHDKSVDEVARIVGIPANTVKRWESFWRRPDLRSLEREGRSRRPAATSGKILS
jgi:RNA polymerase sigma factor (sigma-70 family)